MAVVPDLIPRLDFIAAGQFFIAPIDGEIILALDELENCVDVTNTEKTYEQKELTWVLNQFLSSLSATERNVFLCRYWYMDSIKAISEYSGFSQSKITSMLHRTRDKLRKRLIEEGYL